jgi:hypothetical protein
VLLPLNTSILPSDNKPFLKKAFENAMHSLKQDMLPLHFEPQKRKRSLA